MGVCEGDEFDYRRVFGGWREAFGGALEVRPYAAELLVGRDVVTDFWHAAGLGEPPAAPRGRPNPRAGARIPRCCGS